MSSSIISSKEVLLDRFKSQSVLVVGDVMLDEFHWCDVTRISPEAPVPVCTVQKTTLAPGGASNVAANLSALGAKVKLCGVIGDDSSGEKFKRTLNAHGISLDGIYTGKQPTILKSRVIAKQQHVVRVDRDPHGDLDDADRQALLNLISATLSDYDAIVLSDYLKGVLSPDFTQAVIALAKEKGCPVIVDPKGPDYSKYKGASVITPNFSEFCLVTKQDYDTDEALFEAARVLSASLDLESLIITRSEKGMSIVSGNDAFTIPTQAIDVFDITGAGDTVISALVLGIVSGLPLDQASRVANAAAGIVVGKVGTAYVSPDELKAVLSDELFA